MKKAILIGLIAGITGIAIGYKVPKNKNVGYVMIFGRVTNPEQAGKYFAKINDVVITGCGAKTFFQRLAKKLKLKKSIKFS